MDGAEGAAGAFRQVGEALAAQDPAVTQAKMMGMPCLKARGKMFAGLWREDMTFKLAGEAHRQALDLPGAVLFDPGEMGRPWKAWVQAPFAQREAWPALAEAALQALGG